ncbi:MAG: 50S ribosomal protein L4 [Nitrosomonas sp.]|jgi:large subunit ribosomal protein L4
MELRLLSKENQSANVVVSDALFNKDYNEGLVHQLVTSYLSNARLGTRAQKGRSDVAKSTKKPWRQKGTGRARAGMASSPLWRGGGKIFPNNPNENFKKKINKKMYKAGMCVILSQLIRDERLLVIDNFTVDTHKTKEMAEKLKNNGLNNVLIVTHELDDNLFFSARNIPNVWIAEPSYVDPVSLLKFEKTIVTLEGIRKFEEILS